MGKGQNSTKSRISNEHTWEEVRQNDGKNGSEKWIVINGEVYDVTKWSKKHPGGSKVISHYAGQDATVRFSLLLNRKVLLILISPHFLV